jgi:hypothetical protein
MKSIEEIQTMLVSELSNSVSRVKSMSSNLEYYNEILGDTSFLLAGLLDSLLKLKDDWDSKKWIDDSLLMKVNLNQNRFSIWGVMIGGVENVTDQWTDPFYFEIELNKAKSDFNEYTFLFSDLYKSEISYEEFRDNRSYWRPSTSNERDWKYVINQKNSKGSKE